VFLKDQLTDLSEYDRILPLKNMMLWDQNVS